MEKKIIPKNPSKIKLHYW